MRFFVTYDFRYPRPLLLGPTPHVHLASVLPVVRPVSGVTVRASEVVWSVSVLPWGAGRRTAFHPRYRVDVLGDFKLDVSHRPSPDTFYHTLDGREKR